MNRLTTIAAVLVLACGTASARDLWHQGSTEILSADQAFQLMPPESQGHKLHVEWNIAPGYYLYLNRLHVEAVEPAGAKLGIAQLPAGEKLHDENFGDVEIYRGAVLAADFNIDQPVHKIKLSYQGCAAKGVCLPPQTRIIEVLENP